MLSCSLQIRDGDGNQKNNQTLDLPQFSIDAELPLNLPLQLILLKSQLLNLPLHLVRRLLLPEHRCNGDTCPLPSSSSSANTYDPSLVHVAMKLDSEYLRASIAAEFDLSVPSTQISSSDRILENFIFKLRFPSLWNEILHARIWGWPISSSNVGDGRFHLRFHSLSQHFFAALYLPRRGTARI